jgi:hypothetical protein
MSEDRITISWDKGLTKITFDSAFKAKNGAFWGVKMIDYNISVADSAVNTDLKKGLKSITIHRVLGHCVQTG